MSYNKDLEINKHKLDEELIRQPQLYMEWAIKAVDATVEKEQLKNKLEIVKAIADKEIRQDPQKFGIEKITESVIKSAIALHPEVEKYNKKYLDSLKNEKVLNEAKIAFHQRRKMLE